MNVCLDSSQRAFGCDGDFCIGQADDVAQHDRFPLRRWELVEKARPVFEVGAVGGDCFRARGGIEGVTI